MACHPFYQQRLTHPPPYHICVSELGKHWLVGGGGGGEREKHPQEIFLQLFLSFEKGILG